MNDELKPGNEDEFMRVSDAASMSKVSQRTIWRMIADGQLTPYRFRRCTRLLRSQVLGYFKGNGNVGGV